MVFKSRECSAGKDCIKIKSIIIPADIKACRGVVNHTGNSQSAFLSTGRAGSISFSTAQRKMSLEDQTRTVFFYNLEKKAMGKICKIKQRAAGF